MKVLIIGTGSIGQRHARVILHHYRYEIVLCDVFESSVKCFADELGVSEWYVDVHTAITQSKAEVAIICTPTVSHANYCIMALNAGMQVLCEKPLCMNESEANQIWETEQRTGNKVMIGYTLRAFRILQELYQLLRQGTIGTIVSAKINVAAPETLQYAKSNYRASYETGGGIIYDYSHELDYSRLLFGDFHKAACFLGKNLKPEQTVDDNANILIEFQSGVIAMVHMNYIQESGENRGRNISIIGDKGFIFCDFSKINISLYNQETIIMTFQDSKDDTLIRQFGMFIEYISGHENKFCAKVSDGIEITKWIVAMYKSAATNQMIEMEGKNLDSN